ncbi:MAG: hypothetical protein AAF514_12680, partial [Verrucomicrobiota bacterium]
LGMENTELVRSSVEQLKRLAIEQLTQNEVEEAGAVPVSSKENKLIYLICDPQDERAVEPVEDYFYDLGYEVKVPAFDGDPQTFIKVHQEILTMCAGALIFFGRASNQWVETKLMDLLKAPGFGRKQPLDAQAIYIAPPDNRRKDRFRTRRAMVLRGGEEFDPSTLQPFLAKLGPPAGK